METEQDFACEERLNELELLYLSGSGEKKRGKGNAKKAKEYAEEAELKLEELLGAQNLENQINQKYYLTTAINYANGSPHMGHAYEAILTDCFARYRRLAGYETFFLTGADEHGQKIANTAERLGRSPQDLVDDCVRQFKSMDKTLDVSYDRYIRTTSDFHKVACRELWQLCAKDITLEEYEGWYDERAEMFVKQSDAELQNYCDADGIPLKKTKEACYFFHLGKYAEHIKKHIIENPGFIVPESRRVEVLKMLEDSEALEKLSISRTTFNWGVSLPSNFDQGHVMYVWIDALTNYLSGIGFADGSWQKMWPADCHVIGKDIVRFHAIYWPAFLLSAGIPLPKCIYCHGFVLDANGAKMSKTLGNVIDALGTVEKFGADAFRYYALKDASPGADVKFSETALIVARNSELGGIFGNLVHRAAALAETHCQAAVPEINSSLDIMKPFDLEALRTAAAKAADIMDAAAYATATMTAARDANKWLQDMAPWQKDMPSDKRTVILRFLLEACYALALFLAPLLPRAATRAVARVGGSKSNGYHQLSPNFDNLTPGAKVTPGPPLFAQIELSEDVASALIAEKKTKGSAAAASGAAAGSKKQKKAPAAKEADFIDYADNTPASRLALVVGKIVECWPHPDSEKLFCERIDCGEAKLREIGSGLRAHYTADELKDKRVLIAANLKTRKLAGFPSQGMVLCATTATKTVCIEPPADAKLGDRVELPGLPNPPASEKQCDKLKLFQAAQPSFVVKESICYYKDKPFLVGPSLQPCTAPADDGAAIS